MGQNSNREILEIPAPTVAVDFAALLVGVVFVGPFLPPCRQRLGLDHAVRPSRPDAGARE